MSAPRLIEPALWAQVESRIAAANATALAADLVRIPSHPGVPRQEEAVARALAGWLGGHGVPAQLVEAAPGRPNVLARAGSRAGDADRLVLCGHLDTVPLNAGDPGHGFSGEVRDGRLLGRGSTDMKGAVAAMAAAVVALDGLLDGDRAVELAAVADEELESIGAEAYVRALDGNHRPRAAVIGEPTSNRLALGHKGLEWLAIDFRGRAAHGGTPERGINAINAAARFAALVEQRLQPALAARRHPLIGPPTINFGTIRGGDQPSTVAANCELTLDRRSVPGETYDSIVAELRELLVEVEHAFPGLETRVRRTEGAMATMEHRALVTGADHPLAIAAVAARRLVLGDAAAAEPAVAFPAWTDGALFASFGDVPTIVLGPGDLADAHSPRESIAVDEIETAARIYAAMGLLGVAAP